MRRELCGGWFVGLLATPFPGIPLLRELPDGGLLLSLWREGSGGWTDWTEALWHPRWGGWRVLVLQGRSDSFLFPSGPVLGPAAVRRSLSLRAGLPLPVRRALRGALPDGLSSLLVALSVMES